MVASVVSLCLAATKVRVANAHCVLLEHYYSMDFTWWFDRKISFFSIPSKTAKKFVNWQQFKAALCDLTEKNCFRRIKPSNWSGGQTNGWILLKQKLYYVSFYSIFCRLSPFHREWPQLATILTSFYLSFGTKFKSSTFELKQAIHGEIN